MKKKSVMTTAQAAEYFQVTPRTVTKWCRERRLSCYKIGRVWRVSCLDGVPTRREA